MNGGIVGVIANDFARASLFTACVWRLDMPDGWRKEPVLGGDWCSARNALCQMVLDTDASHLWFMDDDHAFAPSMLKRLLAHDEALVTPICLTRVHPFAPVQYTEKTGDAQYLPIKLSDTYHAGLVEIQAGGCAGMLIRRDVIEAIEPPWFEYTDRSEDIVFCEKAKAAGFTLYADLDATLGHITTAVVHPTVRDSQWMTGLTIGRDLNLVIDTADTVVAAESPNESAQVETWVWEMRSLITGAIHARLLLPAGVPFNLDTNSGVWPTVNMQWWCDDGQGFKPVGDPFLPRPEEH